jgi:hypothetical protein
LHEGIHIEMQVGTLRLSPEARKKAEAARVAAAEEAEQEQDKRKVGMHAHVTG